MPQTPLHNAPIPFITLPNWVKAATVCGFNIEPIFARLGIQTDLTHLEDATITAPVLGQVMEACVEASRTQHFPFTLGETFAFDYLPDIGTFLATAPTLREAMRVFDWVRNLINPMIDFRLDESGGQAALELLSGDGPVSEQERYFVESIFASVVRFGRMLSSQLEHDARLQFRFAPPSYAHMYEPFFRIPVQFSQPRHAVEMPLARLDAVLDGGFVQLHRQAEQRIVQKLATLPRYTGLVAMIEEALASEPQLLGKGIDAVAKRVDIHARTLQRRLRDEGETFASILDRVRYRLAVRALQQDDCDLETISEQLGFSDRRSFTRAFTRWAGVSPSHFRERGDV